MDNQNQNQDQNQDQSAHPLPPQIPATPIIVPPEGVNLEQVPTTDPDVLFRGAFGAAFPQFSVTINRTNIGPGGNANPNGEPVFNLANIPPFLRDMIENVMQQQSPSRTHKRATEDAIDHLEVVDPEELPQSERTCPICYDAFDTPKKSNDSPSVKEDDLKRKRAAQERVSVIGSDPGMWFPVDATARTHTEFSLYSQSATDQEKEKEDLKQPEHIPVRMPCKHIFGRSCLTEWLKSNVSCPLCRREVESQPVDEGETNGSSSLAGEQRAQSLIIGRGFCPADWSTPEHTHEDPAIPIPSVSRSRTATSRPRRVIELTQPYFII